MRNCACNSKQFASPRRLVRPFTRSQRSIDLFAITVALHLLPLNLPVAFAIVSAAVTSLRLDDHHDVLDKLVLLLLLRHCCSRPACQKVRPSSRPRAQASHRRRASPAHCLEAAPREANSAGKAMSYTLHVLTSLASGRGCSR